MKTQRFVLLAVLLLVGLAGIVQYKHQNLQFCCRIVRPDLSTQHVLVKWNNLQAFLRTQSWRNDAEIIIHNPCRDDLWEWEPTW